MKLETVGYYYGSVIYAELSNERYGMEFCKQRAMQESADFYPKQAITSSGTAVDSISIDREAWSFPRLYYIMWYTEDARKFVSCIILESNWLRRLWQNDKHFMHETSSLQEGNFVGFRNSMIEKLERTAQKRTYSLHAEESLVSAAELLLKVVHHFVNGTQE